jgi:prevent-host-death family protein
MEEQIGATELRQNLTNVLQNIRETQAVYVVETFGRPQAALISVDEYRDFQQFQRERASFFQWLHEEAAVNAAQNQDLTEQQILALIDEARNEVAGAE